MAWFRPEPGISQFTECEYALTGPSQQLAANESTDTEEHGGVLPVLERIRGGGLRVCRSNEDTANNRFLARGITVDVNATWRRGGHISRPFPPVGARCLADRVQDSNDGWRMAPEIPGRP